MKLPLRMVMGLGICVSLLTPQLSSGYGNDGHETVGALAEELLQGSAAGTEVRRLLGNESLQDSATWPDRAKQASTRTAEMRAFIHDNGKHKNFHYTDIPFQETSYSPASVGAEDIDIVHAINACIANLKRATDGPATIAPLKNVDKKTALRLLAHYLGDIHQPLHVGAAYIDDTEHFINPNTHHVSYEADEGGNFLEYRSSGLHSYWDDNTVSRVMTKNHVQSPQALATALKNKIAAPAATSGAVSTWSKKWANEALPIAKKAHEASAAVLFTLGHRQVVTDPRYHETHLQWQVTPPSSTYEDWARDTVEQELAKGGYRLAALLKQIWPDRMNVASNSGGGSPRSHN